MQLTASQPEVHQARWWETMADGRIHCYLCPRHCHIGEGQSGFCFIRKNEGGQLFSSAMAGPRRWRWIPSRKSR